MSKSSNFSGQPVCSQVINLLDKAEIVKISRRTAGSEDYISLFFYDFLQVFCLSFNLRFKMHLHTKNGEFECNKNTCY